MPRLKIRGLPLSLGLSTGLALLLSILFVSQDAFQVQQSQAIDFLFRVAHTSPATDFAHRIVIIAMDDKSLARLGQWSTWPREYYARIVARLAEAKARVVGLDVGFFEPREDDPLLAQAIREAGMVVQPVVGAPPNPQPAKRGDPHSFQQLLRPVPELAAASVALGHANVTPDDDGTVRRVPLFIRVEGTDYPLMSLAVAAQYLRRPSVVDGSASPPLVPFAGRLIPVDDYFGMAINYVGPPSVGGSSSFRTVPFVDVLEGAMDASLFQDKIVLLGWSGATGSADDYWVPTSAMNRSKMSGVEIHANSIATILAPAFLVPQSAPYTVTIIFVFALLVGYMASQLRILWAGLATVVLGAFYYGVASVAFERQMVMNLLYPGLALLLSFLGVVSYRVIFEDAEKRAARRALGQYLSPVIMEEVLKDPNRLALGGDKREMTVLFSDIRGFTSFSEKLDPESLVHLLNQYLTAMTEVVFKYEGVLDKFMGDAVMAFWGAPLPQQDHAIRGCRTALEMMQKLSALHARWATAGIPLLNIGIGLNTGTMSVGNMGSSKRFDYTVMGDAVNLGSRLEGANKEYATNIIISESTCAAIREADFVVRSLDLIVVQGKTEPVEIYELLGTQATLDSRWEGCLAAYEDGVRLYRAGHWDRAQRFFEDVLRIRPEDGPSQIYLERCRDLMASPPEGVWDGVYVMTHK